MCPFHPLRAVGAGLWVCGGGCDNRIKHTEQRMEISVLQSKEEGVAPNTLGQTLVQRTRWSEGQLQIAISKYSPIWYGFGKISMGLQMVYLCYDFWAVNSLATLCFSIVPSLCLLKGIPLFPKV